MATTVQLCDKCSIVEAQVSCLTQHGVFKFCNHDWEQAMKHREFQSILIETAPIQQQVSP